MIQRAKNSSNPFREAGLRKREITLCWILYIIPVLWLYLITLPNLIPHVTFFSWEAPQIAPFVNYKDAFNLLYWRNVGFGRQMAERGRIGYLKWHRHMVPVLSISRRLWIISLFSMGRNGEMLISEAIGGGPDRKRQRHTLPCPRSNFFMHSVGIFPPSLTVQNFSDFYNLAGNSHQWPKNWFLTLLDP